MIKNVQLFINLITSILAFVINGVISFVLTPYVTNNLGVDAYGFISLGQTFITYASIVTIALNSMAGRFITIEIHKGNWDEANMYYNSVIRANLFLAFLLMIPSILCVYYIDSLLNVPISLVSDVRILFLILFSNFLISVVMSTFSVSTFATNKLHLKSLRTIESIILKAITLFILFIVFKPALSFVGYSSFLALLYLSVFDIYYTKKFLKGLRFNKKYFNIHAILDLLKSGVWNSIITTGQVLLNGLDLLISNLFIGSLIMGSLAIAKTLPMLILSLVGVVASVFIPVFTEDYVKSSTETLIKSVKLSMKVLGLIVNIPVAILLVYGVQFYSLWIPVENANLLHVLSILSVVGIVVSGPINSLYGIFTVTNKLKLNAIILLISGVLNLGIVIILLNNTSLGIYAIAGVSTLLSIIRNLMFTAPFGARYLNAPTFTFYPDILKSIIGFIVIVSTALLIGYINSPNSWIGLLINSMLVIIIGVIANVFILLNRAERKDAFAIINGLLKQRNE